MSIILDLCVLLDSIVYCNDIVKFADCFQSTWYLKANGVVKSVGIIKFPTRPILAAPDEQYCEECAAGDGIRRTNALVLSAPRLVVA